MANWDSFGVRPILPLLPANNDFSEPVLEPPTEPPGMNKPNIAKSIWWDVSKWQVDINHASAAQAIDAVVVKAAEGNDHTDPYYSRNVAGFVGAGTFTIVYHYFVASHSAPSQMTRFVGAMGTRTPTAVAIDVEENRGDGGVDINTRSDRVWELCNMMADAYKNVIIYTRKNYWESAINTTRHPWQKFGLWTVDYRWWRLPHPPATETPVIPRPWTDWVLWQWTSLYRHPAVTANTIDHNYGRWTLDEFRQRWGAPGPADQFRELLVATSAEHQSVQYHWDAALLKAMSAVGFFPVGNEYDVSYQGTQYIAQGAETLSQPGTHRVYYVPVGDWGNVKYVER